MRPSATMRPHTLEEGWNTAYSRRKKLPNGKAHLSLQHKHHQTPSRDDLDSNKRKEWLEIWSAHKTFVVRNVNSSFPSRFRLIASTQKVISCLERVKVCEFVVFVYSISLNCY
jgi:hypothetical protein